MRLEEIQSAAIGEGRGRFPSETCPILCCFLFLSPPWELLPQVAQGNMRQGLLKFHLDVEGT